MQSVAMPCSALFWGDIRVGYSKVQLAFPCDDFLVFVEFV